MVQPAFDIGTGDLSALPENSSLLIEISGQSFNYLVFTREPFHLHLLREYRMYTTGDKTSRDLLEEIISEDPVLGRFGANAVVVYNFPDATILPEEGFDVRLNGAITRLVYGDAESGFIFNEPIAGLDMHNVYCVSRDLHAICRDRFKGSQYWHIYTILLRWSQQNPFESPAGIRVIFYHDKFIAAFFVDGKLQLIQTFTYQTPEDAAYYLLLIAKQFEINPQQLVLHISGLIDSQSALYTELMKYFSELVYEGIPDTYSTNGLLQEFPPHYFSPLLRMSLCV